MHEISLLKLISFTVGTVHIGSEWCGYMAESTADPTQAEYAPKSGGIPLDSMWCANNGAARIICEHPHRHIFRVIGGSS